MRMLARIMRGGNPGQSFVVLTPREAQVLELLAEGCSNGAIAADLTVTRKTVERHINNLYTKLAIHADSAKHPRVEAARRWWHQDAGCL